MVGVHPICDKYYSSKKDIWFQGEPTKASFPLQLLAVYSYAPVCFVLKTNLLLGELYLTVNASVNPRDGSATRESVPFSSFFDHSHFIWYWNQHKLETIPTPMYKFCFERNSSKLVQHKQIAIQRIPEFKSYKNHEFNKLLEANKVKTFPFPNHSLIKIEGKFKTIGFYNFWDQPSMLNYVHQSLKPAPAIAKFSDAVIQILSKPYFVIHLRLDEESFPSSILDHFLQGKSKNKFGSINIMEEMRKNPTLLSNSTGSTSSTNGKIIDDDSPDVGDVSSSINPKFKFFQFMNYFHHSSCFKDLQRIGETTFIDPPSIYLIIEDSSTNSRKKLKLIIQQFSYMGFMNVYTRKSIIDQFAPSTSLNGKKSKKDKLKSFMMNPSADSFMSSVSTGIALHKLLAKEQFQYVDILLAKSSDCFIPSELPSFLSYLIKRLKALDAKATETYDSVNMQTYGGLFKYRDWGL